MYTFRHVCMWFFLFIQMASTSWQANFEPAFFDIKYYGFKVSVSPNGSFLAIIKTEKNVREKGVRIIELASQSQLASIDTEGSIKGFLFSPDSRFLAVDFSGESSKIFNASNGQMISELPEDVIKVLCFSPDSSRIAVLLAGKIMILNTIRGDGIKFLDLDLSTVPGISGSCSFSPDNSLIAVDFGPSTRVFDQEGNTLHDQKFDTAGNHYFSPDGRFLIRTLAGRPKAFIAFEVKGNTLKKLFTKWGEFGLFDKDSIWYVRSKKIKNIKAGTGEEIKSIAYVNKPYFFSNPTLTSEHHIAIDKEAATVYPNVKDGSKQILQHHMVIPASAQSALFNQSGSEVMTIDKLGTRTIWDLKTGKHRITQESFDKQILDERSPDDARIEIAGDGKTLKVRNGITSTPLSELNCFGDVIKWAFFNRDGSQLIIASQNNFKIIDMKNGTPLLSSDPSNKPPVFVKWARTETGALISPLVPIYSGEVGGAVKGLRNIKAIRLSHDDSNIIIITSHSVRAWDIKKDVELYALEDNILPYTPKFPYAIITKDKSTQFWNIDTGLLVHTISEEISTFQLSPEGRQFLTVDTEKTAKIWDSETKNLLYSLPEKIAEISFNADGSRLLSVNLDGTAQVWQAKTGLVIHTFPGKIKTISMSPEGSKILTIDTLRIPKIWDAITFDLIRTLEFEHKNLMFINPTFQAEGNIITGTFDRYLRVWFLPSNELLFPSPDLTSTIYLKLLKSYLGQLNKNKASYEDFINFLLASYSTKTQYASIDKMKSFENVFFHKLEPKSQQYLRVLLPGRPQD